MKTIIDPENYDKTLSSYKGSFAKIWLFNVTHKKMTLRLWWPNTSSNFRDVLYVVGISCEYMKGPFSWHNSDIVIEQMNDEKNLDQLTKIIDKKAGFELICSGGLSLLTGPENELDQSFDNFLGQESL